MFFSRPSLALLSVACGVNQIITYGSLAFITLFLMREKAMTLNQVAVWYALVVGLGMTGGIFVSGRLVDLFCHRLKQAYALIPALGLIVACPLFVAFIHAPTWQIALAFLIAPIFLNYFR